MRYTNNQKGCNMVRILQHLQINKDGIVKDMLMNDVEGNKYCFNVFYLL